MKTKLVLALSFVLYAQSSYSNSTHGEGHADTAVKAVHAAQVVAKGTEKSVTPEVALGWLKNGNTRFKKGFVRKDGQSQKDVTRLSTGQAPHSIVLSCSDSRVPPEVVFDQKLGEIFTVRTAGQALNDNAVGSIEYAVEHLGTKLIVVMGHTNCGAVKAALGTLDGKDAGTPALNGLVKDIHPRLQAFKGKTPSADVEVESWANVDGVAKDLLLRSELLRKKFKAGEIQFQTALYHLDSGNVEFAKKVELRQPASSTAGH